MQFLVLLAIGLALGAANIVPGVSGATLAVIFRVYDRLIESINTLFSDTKRALLFLVPVGLGMVIGILVVGTVLDGFFDRFSFQTSAFIAGLVAGGIPFIYSQAVSKDGKKPGYYIVAAVAAAVIVILVLVTPEAGTQAAGDFSWRVAILLFTGGMAAAAAMVVPGVSGAMVLMLFGLLPTVMDTISQITSYLASPLDFSLLRPVIQVAAPLGLGIVAGILIASKLIAFLLKRYFTVTYFAILGMVIGTIFAVFHNPDTYQSVDGMTAGVIIFGMIAFLLGMIIALMFGKRQPRDEGDEGKEPSEDEQAQ